VRNKLTSFVEPIAAMGLRDFSGMGDLTIDSGTFRDFVPPAKAGVQSVDAVGNLRLMRGCFDGPQKTARSRRLLDPAFAGETNMFVCADPGGGPPATCRSKKRNYFRQQCAKAGTRVEVAVLPAT
ncbi:MAG: hypothetical protein WBP11_09410, partial [Dokdonella sp.]